MHTIATCAEKNGLAGLALDSLHGAIGCMGSSTLAVPTRGSWGVTCGQPGSQQGAPGADPTLCSKPCHWLIAFDIFDEDSQVKSIMNSNEVLMKYRIVKLSKVK